MCGIIGIASETPVVQHMLESLAVLEYRGYDSVGVAVSDGTKINVSRAVGRLEDFAPKVPPFSGCVGMGHTRWATHGKPEERNAHPQYNDNISVVHNGIIENFAELKAELLHEEFTFHSDTDTEVLVYFLDSAYKKHGTIEGMMQELFARVHGTFAIVVMMTAYPHLLLAARKGSSPIVVGRGEKKMLISSDALGLVGLGHDISYLPDGAWVMVKKDFVEFFTAEGQKIMPQWQKNPFDALQVQRGAFPHFMLKEIHEQLGLFRKYVTGYATPFLVLSRPQAVTFMGCGTAFYASWVGKYFWEALVQTPAVLELASEFHSREPQMFPGMTVAVSQSGETADTVRSAEIAKNKGQYLVGVVNVEHSALTRMAQTVLPLEAGPEIGVASTKAFTSQMWVLLRLALSMTPSSPYKQNVEKAMASLPEALEGTFQLIPRLQEVAQELSTYKHILYLGRGPGYPLALEGALKMKELSYIHAEGMASGELKHGSLAMIQEDVPVIFLLIRGISFEKVLSNIHEVSARGGRITVITDTEGARMAQSHLANITVLCVPSLPCPEILSVFLYAVVMQLLAYYTADYLGNSVDKPRNLAKSVTVY